MKTTNLVLLLLLLGVQACNPGSNHHDRSDGDAENVENALRITFGEDEDDGFSADEKNLIADKIRKTERDVRKLLPSLPGKIDVYVSIIDRDIDIVGGVTGRASEPGKVQIELSRVYPGGVLAAAENALHSSIFHEFHHLYRGWTIQGNKYGPGIAIAAVNEGLADVFTETYTGVYFEDASGYPENVDDWLAEISALPPDADYGTWMFQHPDGRTSIGYRVGRYIVHKAIRNSGMDILALGELAPSEILDLARPSDD